ncbi:IS1634 family transposase [[Eubacterium] hominis]|uniref:IS1634 family transposase n=1 Tax=[Eubacterium] hominis TaxID=2764325 RepID=UPI003A4D8803
MNFFKPVKCPDRTVLVHSKSGTYVYLTQKVEYKPELQCSRPKRVAIGKLNEDGDLIPNSQYFKLFEKEEMLLDPSDRGDFISFGPRMVFHLISEQIGLYEVLSSVFKKECDMILDIASFMIMSENNVMQYFEDYAYNHALFNEKVFSDIAIGRLLQGLNIKDIDLFIKSWVKLHTNKEIYISYDSTNMNCVAGSLELAEYGHVKDNPDLPQINVSLGYDQTDQTPLFYELYPGSINDNTECEKMVERAYYYDCKNIGFILDRGYFSVRNIKFFENFGYDYVLMTKGNTKFVQKAVEECAAVLKNGYSGYIEEYELYGMTVEQDLFGTDRKQYIHVYYNGIQAESEKLQLNNRLKKMDSAMEEKVQRKLQRREDLKSYESYYKVKFDGNGYLQTYQRKEDAIRKEISKMGYFVIVTSKKMESKEALSIYRDRDAVEKVFRMEKSYLGFDVFRVQNVEKLESKVFISFIALIIRNEIYRLLKPLYKKNRKEYTVPKVLRQIERMRLTKLSDEKYHLRYALTSNQKKILESVSIGEKEYKEYAQKIKDQIEC